MSFSAAFKKSLAFLLIIPLTPAVTGALSVELDDLPFFLPWITPHTNNFLFLFNIPHLTIALFINGHIYNKLYIVFLTEISIIEFS